MWHPKKILDPFLTVFSHFFMSYFDVFGSIFEKSAMTDLPKVIVSICLVSYNICMIPHVWRLTFGLNSSGAWGEHFAPWFCIPSPRHTRSSQRKKDFRYFNSKLMRGSQTVLTEVQPLSDILWWVASPGREKRRRGREDGGEEMVTGPLVTLFLSGGNGFLVFYSLVYLRKGIFGATTTYWLRGGIVLI